MQHNYVALLVPILLVVIHGDILVSILTSESIMFLNMILCWLVLIFCKQKN